MHARFTVTIATAAVLAGAVAPNTLHAQEKAKLGPRLSSGQPVDFDVYLPLQNRSAVDALLKDLSTQGSPSYHRWLTPAEFNSRFAASEKQVKAIEHELSASGLSVTAVSAHRLHVSGSASAVELAFGTQLHDASYHNGKHTVVAATPISTPAAMSSIGAFPTGLSGTIRMQAHSVNTGPANRYSTAGPYWFDDLKQAYAYPSFQAYTGKGTTIAILMAGDYQASDMNLYFSHEKLPTPNYSEVKVNGGAPFDPNGGSFETHLDMQQTGGMAPNANIVLYNIPDLADSNIMAGLSQIIDDNKADVVSMSFGGPELFYTAAYNNGTDYTSILQQEDDLFAQGNAQGITFVASSGDYGAVPAPPLACFTGASPCGSFQASVEFPASSPHVTGVGGTNLVTTHTGTTLDSAYVSEEAYADPLTKDIEYGTAATGGFWGSGGGNSIVFSKPFFQYFVNTGENKVRTVPDVSLHMGGCPADAVCNPQDSADIEALAGGYYGVIGTSASAPDFAGLTALNVQRFGTRMGNENYYIYALAAAQSKGLPTQVFHTGIPGYNGLYSTSNGYNRVLGNGTLNGVNFLLAPLTPAAGTPQSPSNP